MSQTAIPLEFEHYLQNQISIGKSPDMNEMIFAYIPSLDSSMPINRENGLPELSTWVHQQDIDQVGKLGPNALAYSVVIPGSAAEFTFNAIYLRDKNVPNSCGMVVHKVSETKESGMASTKSLVQEYTGAASTAAITLDAATWQIDYQARLLGIDEEHRLANLDTYGHTAFIEGFTITQQADPTKYKITPGVVYVGGLRGVLAQEVIQTITTKPIGLYVDVVRQGSSLSVWENKLAITASETDLTDYVDGQGAQHYVAKLVTINADGSTTDEQVKGGLAEHIAGSDPHPQYATEQEVNALIRTSQFQLYSPQRAYSVGEVCYTKDVGTGELSYWQWYSNVESLVNKSPLLESNRHVGWSDNSKPFYWIAYTGDQVGMPFYWLDITAPEWAVMEINVDLPIAVYWRLARRYPNLVSGNTINTGEIRAEFLRVLDQGRGVDNLRTINTFQNDEFKAHAHTGKFGGNVSSGSTGGLAVSSSYGHKSGYISTEGGNETRPRNIARSMAIAI
ncbi:phage tail protein [Aliivibrio kagoshimensis]|uniref:phage tail-collar fiber domain-containing protein n=1 Tax=Aliivibrio kagoshimensis TaxID=2910230 RepID=UPI003D14A3B7